MEAFWVATAPSSHCRSRGIRKSRKGEGEARMGSGSTGAHPNHCAAAGKALGMFWKDVVTPGEGAREFTASPGDAGPQPNSSFHQLFPEFLVGGGSYIEKKKRILLDFQHSCLENGS